MDADKIKEICLKHKVIDEDVGGATRIAEIFLPIFNSNLKRRRHLLEAVAISINQFCHEASVLEKAMLSTIISEMLANRSEGYKWMLTHELQQENTGYDDRIGKELLRNRGIKNIDDVLAKIQEEYDAK